MLSFIIKDILFNKYSLDDSLCYYNDLNIHSTGKERVLNGEFKNYSSFMVKLTCHVKCKNIHEEEKYYS